MRRVAVIGLDGATFDLILPWVAEGKLPGLARLLAEGSHGELASTIPPMTFPAWTSFMTGTNPGKHGVFDFTERRPGSYGIRFVNASWIKSRTIWQIASSAGRRVASISVPVTYPPEPVNGLMISGFDAPGMARSKADARSMYPPSLHEELLKEVGGYVISSNAVAIAHDPDRALGAMLATVDQKIKCARYLYRKEPWDLFMLVLGETDAVGHLFWKYHDPASPLHATPPTLECARALLRVYQRADAFIAELLESAWDSTAMVLVSDHGFGGCSDTVVHLNLWLEQQGFLRFAAPSHSAGIRPLGARARDLAVTCVELAKRLGVRVTPPGLKAWLLRRGPRLVNEMESYLRFNAIDWTHTTAFADENPYYPQIWLNVRGREPQGTVAAGAECEQVRNALIERLSTWTDPETGKRVIRRVLGRDEVYFGPYVDQAPDLLVEWNLKRGYSYVPRLSRPSRGTTPLRRMTADERRQIKSGSHRPHGVLALWGEAVRSGAPLRDATILDVAPTLLYLLGLPILEDMDGRVIVDAIREDVLRSAPPQHLGSDGTRVVRTEEGYGEEDAALIEDRLRGLGYIE